MYVTQRAHRKRKIVFKLLYPIVNRFDVIGYLLNIFERYARLRRKVLPLIVLKKNKMNSDGFGMLLDVLLSSANAAADFSSNPDTLSKSIDGGKGSGT